MSAESLPRFRLLHCVPLRNTTPLESLNVSLSAASFCFLPVSSRLPSSSIFHRRHRSTSYLSVKHHEPVTLSVEYRHASATCYFHPRRVNTSAPASCPPSGYARHGHPRELSSLSICLFLRDAQSRNLHVHIRSGLFVHRLPRELCSNRTDHFVPTRRIMHCADLRLLTNIAGLSFRFYYSQGIIHLLSALIYFRSLSSLHSLVF